METTGASEEWKSFKLNKQLLLAIEEAGYTQPTEVQRKCIPLVLGGQQVIGIAQTGTGKTAAYLLPLLMKVKFAQSPGPRALIVGPTKELVVQVAQNAKQLAAFTDVRVGVIFGGIGLRSQIEMLKNGVDVLVATPGRFLELYQQRAIHVKEIKTLVIDEADRMMDMGFIHQLRRIFDVIPRKRQNLLFSATFSQKVEQLAEDFLEFPHKIEVTPQATAARQVHQEYYKTPNLKTKINFLEYLLRDAEQFKRVMVFAGTKTSASNVFKFIERKGLASVRVIHSNKSQNTRLNALNDFKAGHIRVLVCTDVAARGIDVSKVSHVINFDVPSKHSDYVHRIGRTGRAMEIGKAITLATDAELYHLQKIEILMREKIPEKKLPAAVVVEKTDFEEAQEIARSIDRQRQAEDPTFKGAFHDKKER